MTNQTPTLSDAIAANWDRLSDRAQAHIRETRPELLTQWELWEEGHHYRTIEADTAKEALEAAKGNVDRSNYHDTDETLYIAVSVCNVVTSEEADATVTCDPDEPDCLDGQDHDWQSPIELVGGIKENPGVWGNGGGVVIHGACLRCGCGRVIDTWAQDRSTGRQGLTSVSYEAGKYDLDDLGYVVEERTIETEIDDALAQAGYDLSRSSTIAVSDESRDDYDDPDADATLDEIRAIVEPLGGSADWTGDGNTDADGRSTSDVRIAYPERWVVIDRSADTCTVADDEDAAQEIAYQCRLGHASRYTWIDLPEAE